MKINVRADFKDTFRKLDELSEGIRNKATAAALNRIGDQTKTQAVREISRTYNITATKVRERIKVRKAFAAGRLAVEIAVEGRFGRRATNLITFGARQLKRGGVSVKIRRDKSPNRGKNWFVLENRKTGGKFVAKRVKPGRGGIQPVLTIDVGQMFNARAINDRLIALARERFPRELESRVAFFAAKFNAR